MTKQIERCKKHNNEVVVKDMCYVCMAEKGMDTPEIKELLKKKVIDPDELTNLSHI